jgi:hypothetical protein
MSHLILLGDSIFDNGAYVAGALAVIEQVRVRLPRGWQASLLAVDGNVAMDVKNQLKRLPEDATHMVLSVGGNDALNVLDQLHSPIPLPMMGALQLLAGLQVKFDSQYSQAINSATAHGLPLMICTIYDQVPGLSQALRTSLSLFNDVIVRVGVQRGIPILDLREIYTEPGDYSLKSPIEPSSVGGAKLADRIVSAVVAGDFTKTGCRVYS